MGAKAQPRSIVDLEALQRAAASYFVNEVHLANGLVRDRTASGAPASIAAVGMGLATAPILVERGWLTREEAAAQVLTTLRFFWTSPQGPEPDSSGYQGFFYHFLDFLTGRRAGNCELSTIDSAFLFAGGLAAGLYFHRDMAVEAEIRLLADNLFRRANWRWALNRGATITHGWKPSRGFLRYRWQGYNEALLLYVLALGSPTFSIPLESYAAWCSSYLWRTVDRYEYLHCGPLFTHQFSHLWIDFRGVQDQYMRDRASDYFENSRRATLIQQQYAIHNPRQFADYGELCWGLSASHGPGPARRSLGGQRRNFSGYIARGVPDGPDDGTLAPAALLAALPFAPEIVVPTLANVQRLNSQQTTVYGCTAAFNRSFKPRESDQTWVSPWQFGIDQGAVVLMLENDRSELLWRLMQNCPYVVAGLQRAGFRGGWLGRRAWQ